MLKSSSKDTDMHEKLMTDYIRDILCEWYHNFHIINLIYLQGQTTMNA